MVVAIAAFAVCTNTLNLCAAVGHKKRRYENISFLFLTHPPDYREEQAREGVIKPAGIYLE